MSVIIIVGIIWGIGKLISAASAASKERARQAEIERVRRAQERQRAEQARMREEWKAAQAAERERVRQMVALEREQARQAAQLEKHEAWLKKHDAEIRKNAEDIRKLKQAMLVAEVDIKNANERMTNLYSLLDIAERQQRDAHPGSKSDEAAQRKIMTIRNQLATAKKSKIKAKSKYNELKFKMEELEKKEVA